MNVEHCGCKTVNDIEKVLEANGLSLTTNFGNLLQAPIKCFFYSKEQYMSRETFFLFAWTLACLFLDDVFEMARFSDAE